MLKRVSAGQWMCGEYGVTVSPEFISGSSYNNKEDAETSSAGQYPLYKY